MKDFDTWNVHKKRIDSSNKLRYFHTREVWWTYLGINVGYEQDGKNGDFVRPIVILRKFNKQIFLGIPLTTKSKPNNPFYIEFKHGDQKYSAVISQIKMLDVKRLKRKMYRLDSTQFRKIQKETMNMIEREN